MKEREINLMKRMDRYFGVPILVLQKALRFIFDRSRSLKTVEVQRIVMMKLWGIGNLIMILPLIKAVRKAYPNAIIHFVTLKNNEELLKNVPIIDNLITFTPNGLFRTLIQLFKTALTLRKIKPDLILDFEQFLKVTAILAGFSGGVQSIGFKTQGQARSLLFNVKVPYRKNRHMSLTFGDIVRSAGISTHGTPPLDSPRSEQGARSAAAFIDTLPDKPIVALHLGSGDNFPGRRWPVEKFAHLAQRLINEKDVCCVITGSTFEMDLAAQMKKYTEAKVYDSMGRFDIMTFIEFIAKVDLLVTNDTAPAHIGAALKVPIVAFYGPNTPDLYGPLHEESRVFYNPLPCSPCLTNLNAKTSSCRIPSCILSIKPDDVFDAAVELLSPTSDSKQIDAEGEVP